MLKKPDSGSESSVHRARLFRNGRNQAVRIPRALELKANEVIIYREDSRLIVEPVEQRPSLAEVLSRLKPLDEDFGDLDDPPTRPEDTL